jgi:hypothetical protein
VSIGFASDDETKWIMPRAGELCILAGADESQLDRWIAVGQQRRELARAVPQTYARRRRMWI